MKKCPFCAEKIQDAAIKCKHCSSDLSAQSPPPEISESVQAKSNESESYERLSVPLPVETIKFGQKISSGKTTKEKPSKPPVDYKSLFDESGTFFIHAIKMSWKGLIALPVVLTIVSVFSHAFVVNNAGWFGVPAFIIFLCTLVVPWRYKLSTFMLTTYILIVMACIPTFETPAELQARQKLDDQNNTVAQQPGAVETEPAKESSPLKAKTFSKVPLRTSFHGFSIGQTLSAFKKKCPKAYEGLIGGSVADESCLPCLKAMDLVGTLRGDLVCPNVSQWYGKLPDDLEESFVFVKGKLGSVVVDIEPNELARELAFANIHYGSPSNIEKDKESSCQTYHWEDKDNYLCIEKFEENKKVLYGHYNLTSKRALLEIEADASKGIAQQQAQTPAEPQSQKQEQASTEDSLCPGKPAWIQDDALVGFDENSEKTLAQYLQKNNKHGIARLTGQGTITALTPGTKVLVMSFGSQISWYRIVEVRVLDGPYLGQDVYAFEHNMYPEKPKWMDN